MKFCVNPNLRAMLLAVLVAGCGGGGGGDSGGSSSNNRAPTANAGVDQTRTAGQVVTLAGSGTDPDGTIATFAWTQTAGPAVTLSNAEAVRPTFTAPAVAAAATLTFRLVVTDDDGATGQDTVSVTISPAPPNQAPTANAGADQAPLSGQVVTLSGSGTDAGGTITSFAWTQTAGPVVTLSDAAAPRPIFTAPAVAVPTTLTFMLVVTDDGGATGQDTVNVTVSPSPPNQAPTANAGADQVRNSGQLVTLSGSGTDPDGSIARFDWTQTAGPGVTLSNANAASPTFTAPTVAAATTLTFRLVVTDDDGATGQATVNVTVNPRGTNQAPTANAGADQARNSGQLVTLSGSGSDPDGTIVSFAWTQTAGPAVTLSSANAASPTFTAPTVAAATILTFRLVVTDNGSASDDDSVNVTVSPAVAGNVTLSGKITFDRVPPNPATDGLNYAATARAPARGVTVQAIRSSDGGVLTSAITDGSGNYSISVPSNTRMFVRVRAEMVKTGAAPTWDFRVLDNTSGNALYTLAGTAFDSGTGNLTHNLNAPSGFTSSGNVSGTRSAGPFAILDSVFAAFNKVLAVDATAAFPALVIGWSINNVPAGGASAPPQVCAASGMIGTSFYFAGTICIVGSANNDTDEYDDHVVIHEWGHYFEDKFSRADSVGGPHGGGDRLDMRVAFGEGFGNALSGIVTDNPSYRDSSGSQQSTGFEINVENNANTNPGWYSEGSVQSILYDLYDATNDGADSLTMGFGPLYQVLRNSQRTGVPLTSIFSFITALKQNNASRATGINAVVNGQMINGTNIDSFGSNETNNAGNPDALPVYGNITVNGGAVFLCSTNAFGEYNKLGNRRFLRFDASAGSHTFTAGGAGVDAVMILHRAGQVGPVHDGPGPPTEQFSENLVTGAYVLEVAEFINVDGDAGGGRVCMNVSITR